MSVLLLLKSNYGLFRAIRLILSMFGFWHLSFHEESLDSHWKRRIARAKECPANHEIARVKNAGDIVADKQVMHNGIEVLLGSYYGKGNSILLKKNKGVHEPEEEFLFGEVLKYVRSGGTMIELGSFWGFYSIWFNRTIKDAKSYLIEPDKHALLSGINNFKLNNRKANFFNAFVGERNESGSIPTICIDKFCEDNKIKQIELLHSDIQGYELKMLRGANACLKEKKIDFLFISTHSNELHYRCVDYLKSNDYKIISSIDLNHTHAWDGLILASNIMHPKLHEISDTHGYLLS